MYPNTQKTVTISIIDLLFVILKKIAIVIIAGLIVACALFCYKFILGMKASASDSNVLDVSVRLEGETDAQYTKRVQDVERVKDILSIIDALNDRIEDQNNYLLDSVLMQIDATNEARSTAQFIIIVDDSSNNGIGTALASSYLYQLTDGEYLDAIAEELGTNRRYLNELFWIDAVAPEDGTVYSGDSIDKTVVITISVIGPNSDYTELILDGIICELDSAYAELNESMVSHSISLSNRRCYYFYDSDTQTSQFSAINQIESLRQQITTYDGTLDTLAAQIGVSSKENIYSYFAFNDDSWVFSAPDTSVVIRSATKYAVVGFICGVMLVSLFIALKYTFGSKFSTQAVFFNRFPSVNRIGVMKPTKVRSRFERVIDIKTDNDCVLSDEKNVQLIAANVKNLTNGMNRVLLTGTADTSKIKDLAIKLNIKADVIESFFADPSGLESILKYDGVVIVEQRNYSNRHLITEEIKLIEDAGVNLIGAIII